MRVAFNDLCRLLTFGTVVHEPDRRQMLAVISAARARIMSIEVCIETLEKRAEARGIDLKPDPRP